MKRTEDSLRDLWDNIKHINIYVRWIPEEENKDKRPEKNISRGYKNFTNMGKETVTQVQEV